MPLTISSDEREPIVALSKENAMLVANGEDGHDNTSVLLGLPQKTAPSNDPPEDIDPAEDISAKAWHATADAYARKSVEESEAQQRKTKRREAEARAKAERMRKAANVEFAAIIKKYGSENAALGRTPMQLAIEEAAIPLIRTKMPLRDGKRVRETTLDGWGEYGDPIPEHAGAVIRAALPIPTTIAEAKVELDLWRERNREIQTVLNFYDHNLLSPCCQLRVQIVTSMLADLEHLAEMHAALARDDGAPTPPVPRQD